MQDFGYCRLVAQYCDDLCDALATSLLQGQHITAVLQRALPHLHHLLPSHLLQAELGLPANSELLDESDSNSSTENTLLSSAQQLTANLNKSTDFSERQHGLNASSCAPRQSVDVSSTAETSTPVISTPVTSTPVTSISLTSTPLTSTAMLSLSDAAASSLLQWLLQTPLERASQYEQLLDNALKDDSIASAPAHCVMFLIKKKNYYYYICQTI